MTDLEYLLAQTAARHDHLCPRQVLGVRIGLAGLAALNLAPPLVGKPLIVIVETDGCFTDGIEVATQTTIGHRTLRVEDFGKIAATFVSIDSSRAFRVSPKINVRQKAWEHAPLESERYTAQLQAYQVMPDHDLLDITEVELITPLEKIISIAGVRAICDSCGEEIFNEREISSGDLTLCRACSGASYYRIINETRTELHSLQTSRADSHDHTQA
jgi:formylmethanofuran dehydrogenase subunit E